MSENEIVNRLRSGGQQELGRIYAKYRDEFLHWVVKGFHCSSDDSQDIYQSAILIFYDNVKSGKLQHLDCTVKTYLFAIGKNLARDYVRNAGRSARLQHDDVFIDFMTDQTGEQVEEDLLVAAKNALAKLDEPRRRLLELYYYEKKSMKEISAILQYKNADTTKNQKCKSMARLRELFDEELRCRTIQQEA